MCFRPAQSTVPIICPNCGHSNDGILTSCEECGTRLPKQSDGVGLPQRPPRCEECGTFNKVGDTICSKCGAVLPDGGVGSIPVAKPKAPGAPNPNGAPAAK